MFLFGGLCFKISLCFYIGNVSLIRKGRGLGLFFVI